MRRLPETSGAHAHADTDTQPFDIYMSSPDPLPLKPRLAKPTHALQLSLTKAHLALFCDMRTASLIPAAAASHEVVELVCPPAGRPTLCTLPADPAPRPIGRTRPMGEPVPSSSRTLLAYAAAASTAVSKWPSRLMAPLTSRFASKRSEPCLRANVKRSEPCLRAVGSRVAAWRMAAWRQSGGKENLGWILEESGIVMLAEGGNP